MLTEENIKDFDTADKCHICNKKYTEKDIKVKDHFHITRKYIREDNMATSLCKKQVLVLHLITCKNTWQSCWVIILCLCALVWKS